MQGGGGGRVRPAQTESLGPLSIVPWSTALPPVSKSPLPCQTLVACLPVRSSCVHRTMPAYPKWQVCLHTPLPWHPHVWPLLSRSRPQSKCPAHFKTSPTPPVETLRARKAAGARCAPHLLPEGLREGTTRCCPRGRTRRNTGAAPEEGRRDGYSVSAGSSTCSARGGWQCDGSPGPTVVEAGGAT